VTLPAREFSDAAALLEHYRQLKAKHAAPVRVPMRRPQLVEAAPAPQAPAVPQKMPRPKLAPVHFVDPAYEAQIEAERLERERIAERDRRLAQHYQIIREKQPLRAMELLCAFHLDVNIADLKGERRTQELVRKRQLTMWMMRRFCGASFPTIGRRLGGRDHTTALHACKVMDRYFDDLERNGEEPHSNQPALWLKAMWKAISRNRHSPPSDPLDSLSTHPVGSV
jgi:hypothetical protein